MFPASYTENIVPKCHHEYYILCLHNAIQILLIGSQLELLDVITAV